MTRSLITSRAAVGLQPAQPAFSSQIRLQLIFCVDTHDGRVLWRRWRVEKQLMRDVCSVNPIVFIFALLCNEGKHAAFQQISINFMTLPSTLLQQIVVRTLQTMLFDQQESYKTVHWSKQRRAAACTEVQSRLTACE